MDEKQISGVHIEHYPLAESQYCFCYQVKKEASEHIRIATFLLSLTKHKYHFKLFYMREH